jgi:putative ABC transport system permease protein
MLIEAVVIGLFGSIVGTILALLPVLAAGARVGPRVSLRELVADAQQRHSHRDHPVAFVIGFIPGCSPTSWTAIAGIGIYKRQTATLMKELEA